MDRVSFQEIALFIFIFLGLIVFYTWRFRVKRASAWKGVVADVKSRQQRLDDGHSGGEIQTHHYIRVSLDNGGRKTLKLTNIQMQTQFPGGLRNGDRIMKIAGEDIYRMGV